MRMSIKAAVVAAASTTLLVPAASAFAGSATVNDEAGDTWSVGYDDQGNATNTKSDVTDNADLDKVVIKLGGRRVEVRASYADLKKNGVDFTTSALLRTNTGKKFYMFGGGSNDGTKWHVDGTVFDAGAQSGRHVPVAQRGTTCQGFQTSVDWDANVLVFSAPRSCIGSPNSVTAHVEEWSNSYDATTDTWLTYFDNGHNDTHNSKGWTNTIKKG